MQRNMIIMDLNIGDEIKFDNQVTMKILGLKTLNQVKIGIDAPTILPVYRTEVYNQLIKEKDNE